MLKRIFLFFLIGGFFSPISGYGQTIILDSLVVNPLLPKTNVNTLYNISFISSVEIVSNSQFIINFPDEFILDHLNLVGSSNINGGLLLIRDGQKVTVKRRGEGSVIEPGKRVNLALSIIKNPGIVNSNYQIQFHLANYQGVPVTETQLLYVVIEQ